MLLYHLQLAQLKQSGQTELAEQHRQRFKQLREHRDAYWMNVLQITTLDWHETAQPVNFPSSTEYSRSCNRSLTKNSRLHHDRKMVGYRRFGCLFCFDSNL